MTLFWKKEEVTLDLGLIVMLVFAVHWTITASASDCNRELHRRRYYSACKVKTQLLKNLGSFCRHDHLYLSELCCHQKTATECLCVPYSGTMVLVIKGNVWEVSCLFFNFAAIGKIALQKDWKMAVLILWFGMVNMPEISKCLIKRGQNLQKWPETCKLFVCFLQFLDTSVSPSNGLLTYLTRNPYFPCWRVTFTNFNCGVNSCLIGTPKWPRKTKG